MQTESDFVFTREGLAMENSVSGKPSNRHVTRRQALKGALGLSVATVLGSLLAACGGVAPPRRQRVLPVAKGIPDRRLRVHPLSHRWRVQMRRLQVARPRQMEAPAALLPSVCSSSRTVSTPHSQPMSQVLSCSRILSKLLSSWTIRASSSTLGDEVGCFARWYGLDVDIAGGYYVP
jgi:hypothetical protein